MSHQLQREVGDWHRHVYTDATLSMIALKLAEETGEVCRAVDRMIYQGGWRDQIADEAGDVVIALAALCDRLGIDLDAAITTRWSEVRQRHDESQSDTPDPPDHTHTDWTAPAEMVRLHIANTHRGDPNSPTVINDHRRAHGKPPE